MSSFANKTELLWHSGWPALILLAVVWYFELCLLLKHRPVHGIWFFEQFLRETMFCLLIVLVMPGIALLFFAVGISLFIPAALFYERVFSKPISFTTIRYQWNEGSDSFSLTFLRTVSDIIIVVSIFLVLKLGLLWAAEKYPVSYSSRVPLLLVSFGLFSWVQSRAFKDVKAKLSSWAMPAHLVPRYGYLNVWANEYFHLQDHDLLLQALEARSIRHDRITPAEGRLPLPNHLILVQVESLAHSIVNLEIGGHPVTPFLNSIYKDSMVFKLQAIHNNGSSDTDFIMLHAHMPGAGVATYRIPNYPHEDAFPKKTKEAGMPMTFLHGHNGWMFNRREVFRQMDFDSVIFKEEMVTEFQIQTTLFGRVADQQVFELATRIIREYQFPHVLMIFTLSTHAPYEDLPQDFESAFSKETRDYTMRYCNAMRYFDGALEKFVKNSPERTTFVIFGDHEPVGVLDSQISTRSVKGDDEYVPGIVYQKGENLASKQLTRKNHALTGELTMLDLATWVHGWFR